MSIFYGPKLTLEIRNTACGLAQAGTHFLDHIRSFRSQETYLHRSILTEESLKNKLMPLVRRVAEEDRELPVPV